MKVSKKIMAAATAVASLVGLATLSGCGGSDSAQEEHPDSIKIWYYEEDNGSQGKAWNQAIAD